MPGRKASALENYIKLRCWIPGFEQNLWKSSLPCYCVTAAIYSACGGALESPDRARATLPIFPRRAAEAYLLSRPTERRFPQLYIHRADRVGASHTVLPTHGPTPQAKTSYPAYPGSRPYSHHMPYTERGCIQA